MSEGQTIGLVGESGCGKTTTCLSLVRLLAHGAQIVGGSIKLNGREITGLSESEMASVRGNEIAMILQDPLERHSTPCSISATRSASRPNGTTVFEAKPCGIEFVRCSTQCGSRHPRFEWPSTPIR